MLQNPSEVKVLSYFSHGNTFKALFIVQDSSISYCAKIYTSKVKNWSTHLSKLLSLQLSEAISHYQLMRKL